MRYGMLLAVLAAATLTVSGCKNLPSSPSAPSMPEKPSTPKAEAPSAPKAEVPAKPSTPSAPSAPSTPNAPSAPSTPSAPSAPSTSTAESAAKTATPVDKTPIKGDVSKIKFTSDKAELFGYEDGESRAFFYTNGFGEVTVNVPAEGDYEIVITASCQAAKGENAKFKLKVDGAQVGVETQLKSEDAKDYSFTSALKAGERKIGTEFTNDMYKEGEYDMNFYLNGVKVIRK